MTIKTDFQNETAELVAAAIRQAFPDAMGAISETLQIGDDQLGSFIRSKLEKPKNIQLGDFAFPAFSLAGALKRKPNEIAAEIGKYLDSRHFKITGPYVNRVVSPSEAAGATLPLIFEQEEAYGSQETGRGKNIVIDFSSPNIAKPFGVGHLRSTAIGNSLYRIFEKLGYTCIGINHLGDWGTQFGKVIAAYLKWGDEAELKKDATKHLYQLYVRFHDEEKNDPALAEEGRAWFKKLEDGDEQATALWKSFSQYSLDEFRRIYEILGVRFDHYTGESFYNDKMDAVVERLTESGLTRISEGALIVDLEAYGLTPCLLRRADGATLYATRDLAGILYRHRTYDFYKAIYVVGSSQREHFQQVFKVIELMGEDYADRLVHVEFGWIKFQDKAMSTRSGTVIFLEDVIDTATQKALEIIKEKNPNLPDLEKTALMIGIGAVIFADLGVKKNKDVNFVWEEVLNFEGETGPYLQYTHARLSALMRKYGREISDKVDFSLYDSPEEKELLMHLYRFDSMIEAAAEKYEPNFIAEYLLELAAVFNRFYQRKDAEGRLVKIISDNEAETAARMLLVSGVRTVMREGLRLLGIEAPEEM